MKIIIMHETVTSHDAVGNDIEAMYRILSRENECCVYAVTRKNTEVRYIEERELLRDIQSKETAVIYHHSVYWEHGFEILKKVRGQIIIRYHNVTPEYFFKAYSRHHYEVCLKGREQTLKLQKAFPQAYWLSDSAYNAKDLYMVDAEKMGICPPFHKIEQWGGKNPDPMVEESLRKDMSLKLLFVGRIAPNKGHLKLLEVLRHYVFFYNSDVKLRIIGKFDAGIEKYNKTIRNCIKEYGLEEQVEFVGEITDETLIAYYRGCDIILCCSEHEGFCVPIVEAQYFGLPIVALGSGAVPETLGEEQIVLSDEATEIASALKVLKEHRDVRDYLAGKGRENYENRFSYAKIQENLLKQFHRAFAPAEPAREVSIQKVMKSIQRAAFEERYEYIMEEVRRDVGQRHVTDILPDFDEIPVK